MKLAGPDNVIKFTDVLLYAYDENNKPSCYHDTANVRTPGFLSLRSGTITVTKPVKVVGNRILLTVTKNNFLVNKICEDGQSTYLPMDDDNCGFNCGSEYTFCKLLENPGVYKIEDIVAAQELNNGTFVFKKSFSDLLEMAFAGQWKAEFKLKAEDEILMHVKMPSDKKWIWFEK